MVHDLIFGIFHISVNKISKTFWFYFIVLYSFKVVCVCDSKETGNHNANIYLFILAHFAIMISEIYQI